MPEGGSFGEWTNYVETYWQRLSGLENNRASVVGSMTKVASCQWMQQWLTATSASKDAAAAQAIRVLPGIEEWQRAAGMIIDPGGSVDPLAGWMREGKAAQVQLAENQCAFTGSWGDTVAEQDPKATGDLVPAIAAVRSSLRDGGASADFDWQTGDSIAHSINWTDPKTQPAPLFPGYISNAHRAPSLTHGALSIGRDST